MFSDLKGLIKTVLTDRSHGDPPQVEPSSQFGHCSHYHLQDTNVSATPAAERGLSPDSELHTDSDPAPRKVRIKKVLGQKHNNELPAAFCGVEVEPPEVGERYCVQLADNKIFCSSFVTGVYIQTENSLYQVEFMT